LRGFRIYPYSNCFRIYLVIRLWWIYFW